MLQRNPFSLFVCIVVLLVAGCQPPTPAPETPEAPPVRTPEPEEILQREQQRVELLVSRQYDQLADMLSPSLTYTHSNAVLDSKEEILRDLRNEEVIFRNLQHRDLEVRFVRPDVAILNGITDVSVTVGGEDLEVPLRFTIVYVEEDGEWLFEAWHSVRRPEE